ncbi:MAG TPA: aspartate aminotransferase family protein, partial [Kandleria vitulina]|nr:aspartate aminotransferase family protein [Kandleria vitulina]
RKYYYLKTGKADSEIISFHHSFHGRTTGSVKLTGNPHYQEAFGPLIDGVKYATLNDLDSVKALVTDKTAAIIVEPVQGEGGVNPCTKEFMQGLRALCDQEDICLILDEVQCGMGRTGTIMTYFQFDILPDIVCLAKGIGCGVPVGAFVANKRYGEAMQPGDHGSTYGGNPFVTRAVSTVFDILKEEKIVENAAEVSKYLVAQFDELVKDFKCVESHRGIGLMQGLVLNVPAAKVDQALIKEGLIVVTAGPQVLRFLPPLIITKEHVDAAMTIIRKVLKEFEA